MHRPAPSLIAWGGDLAAHPALMKAQLGLV
jgi:hypothetical protein